MSVTSPAVTLLLGLSHLVHFLLWTKRLSASVGGQRLVLRQPYKITGIFPVDQQYLHCLVEWTVAWGSLQSGRT